MQDIEGVEKISTTPKFNWVFFFPQLKKSILFAIWGLLVRMKSFLPTYWDHQERREVITYLYQQVF